MIISEGESIYIYVGLQSQEVLRARMTRSDCQICTISKQNEIYVHIDVEKSLRIIM